MACLLLRAETGFINRGYVEQFRSCLIKIPDIWYESLSVSVILVFRFDTLQTSKDLTLSSRNRSVVITQKLLNFFPGCIRTKFILIFFSTLKIYLRLLKRFYSRPIKRVKLGVYVLQLAEI